MTRHEMEEYLIKRLTTTKNWLHDRSDAQISYLFQLFMEEDAEIEPETQHTPKSANN